MKPEEIEFFKQLDKECLDGTVQDIVMNPNAPMLYCLKKLCVQLKNEKDVLQKENMKLSAVLKANGLYTRENILDE